MANWPPPGSASVAIIGACAQPLRYGGGSIGKLIACRGPMVICVTAPMPSKSHHGFTPHPPRQFVPLKFHVLDALVVDATLAQSTSHTICGLSSGNDSFVPGALRSG